MVMNEIDAVHALVAGQLLPEAMDVEAPGEAEAMPEDPAGVQEDGDDDQAFPNPHFAFI